MSGFDPRAPAVPGTGRPLPVGSGAARPLPVVSGNGSPVPVVLVTGFEPFDGDAVNASAEVARALHGEQVEGAVVCSLVLPCVFGEAAQTLRAAIARRRPRAVLALGLASMREEVSVERVAINVDDARIPDNAGAQPVDVPVVAGAPAAYFSTLPVKAIVHALRAAGVPAAVSQTAGTYVCNHVFYALMHALRRRRGVRGGFIHLPPLPRPPDGPAGVGGTGGLPLAVQVEAVRLAVAVTLTGADGPPDRAPGDGAVA